MRIPCLILGRKAMASKLEQPSPCRQAQKESLVLMSAPEAAFHWWQRASSSRRGRKQSGGMVPSQN